MAFVDTSTNNFQISAFGNAQISTSVKKYGDGSAYFDGSDSPGSYLEVDNLPSDYLDNDFTIEGWFWINSTNSTARHAFNTFPHTCLNIFTNTDGLGRTDIYVGNGTSWIGTPAIQSSSGLSFNTWNHIAIVRYNNTITLYHNGASQGSTNILPSGYTRKIRIGKATIDAFNDNFNGYIDELRITKGIARYTSNFTPPQQQLPTTADPYFSNVSLLLPMNLGPFTDSSTNNFQLTPAGNADLSKSVVKYGTASGYFDTDYIEAPSNDAFAFGTGDFTVEMWLYPTNMDNAYHVFFDTRPSNGSGGASVTMFLKNTSRVHVYMNLSESFLVSDPISLNTWTHVALVKSNGVHKLYINGTQSGSTNSAATNCTTPYLVIGKTVESPANYYFGYIDDLRITKGVARYTANFTPPQQQLPAPSDPYQDNVSLLLHMDQNQFVDASLNNFTITPFGNARSSTQVVKYGDTAAYFDGSGDYLTIPFDNAFSFGVGSFTFETWIYPTTVSGIIGIYGTSGGSGVTRKFVVHIDNGTPKVHINGPGAPDIYWSATSTVSINTWTHLALIRNGSTWTWYINGVASGTGTDSFNIAFTNELTYIGYGGEPYFNPLNGYIDDLRITKGVARYTTTFTPPSAQLPTFTDPDFANVSLLLQTNRPFTDSSSNNFTLSAFGDAQISTVTKKFGSGAAYFDGDGDYLDLPVNAIQFNADDFTIEFWLHPTRTGTHTCVANWDCSSNMTIFFAVDISAGVVVYLNGTGPYIVGGTIQVNQWQHIALVRQGGNMKAYINGVQAGNTYNIGNTPINTIVDNIRIGRDTASFNCNAPLQGYIDELRITKGVARYTSNFVPHTAPFVNPPPIPSGYLAFWKLADLTDSSPNGYNLVNTNNVQFVAGKIGDCAEFALSKYLSTNINWNVVQNDWSVSFWMFPTSTPANVNTFPLVADNIAGTWLIQYLPSLEIGFSYAASPPLLGSAPLNTWTHVAATKSSAGLKLYINGILQGTSTYIGTLNPTIFRMNTEFNDQVYTGKLDAVSLWNRELTQSEIDLLYNNGNGREP